MQGMPNSRVTCKACSRKFNGVSALRRHQWAEHRERFNKGPAANQLDLPTVALVKAGVSAPKKDMLVSELLSELRDQQKFLADVTSMIKQVLLNREVRR